MAGSGDLRLLGTQVSQDPQGFATLAVRSDRQAAPEDVGQRAEAPLRSRLGVTCVERYARGGAHLEVTDVNPRTLQRRSQYRDAVSVRRSRQPAHRRQDRLGQQLEDSPRRRSSLPLGRRPPRRGSEYLRAQGEHRARKQVRGDRDARSLRVGRHAAVVLRQSHERFEDRHACGRGVEGQCRSVAPVT